MIHFKAGIISRKEYNEHPEEYHRVIILNIDTPWYQAVINYGKENKAKLHEQMVSLENWDIPFEEQAKSFYFLVRDRLAQTSGDTSREYKNHLHRQAKEECGFHDRSLNNLRKHELWELTQLMIRWSEEAESYLVDLMPMYKYLGNRLGGNE